jgi:CO dehydrogenase maturation factor
MSAREDKPLNGKRIGFFGKGGSGKSTVTVILAEALQEHGYDVCVLDADSTNVGLHLALGIDSHPKTLLEYYGGMVFSGGAVTCPVDDPTPLPNATIYLDELPSQYCARNDDGITLLVTGKIGDQGPGAGCDGPVSKIARDFVVRGRHHEFVTLIDFKAGFEDAARGAVTNLDLAIVVVDPTIVSVEIAANMRDMVAQIKADVLPATAHLESPELVALANKIFTEAKIEDVFFVLNQVPNAEIANYLREKLKQREITPVGMISEDPSIPLAWLKSTQVHAAKALHEVQIIVDRLEESIGGSS